MAYFQFTDNQWYNFICGFLCGMKLRNINLPYFDHTVTLKPIPVLGYGTIGLAIEKKVLEQGVTHYSMPVFAHDVASSVQGFSGFSVNIKWDASRLKFIGVTEGEYGTIGKPSDNTQIQYTYSNGLFKARALRDMPFEIKTDSVLFYIDVEVLDEVTSDRPIEMAFNTADLVDLNYTTMLKWVLVEGTYYTFFITPIKNVNGGIYSELPSESAGSGETTEVNANAAPSSVTALSSYTAPGNDGCVGIVACSNVDDNFPYSRVTCNINIRDDDGRFGLLEVLPMEGWSVSYSVSGSLISIVATREKDAIDAVTFCNIAYSIGGTLESYIIPLEVSNAVLYNSDDESLNVEGYGGAITYYNTTVSGGINGYLQGHFNNGENTTKYGGPGNMFSTGGFGGYGSIWSSGRQIVFIGAAGGIKYPILLNPGNNDVNFWVPAIYPEDTTGKKPIVIEAQKYLLIPGGFTWDTEQSEDAPGINEAKEIEREKVERVHFLDFAALELTKPAGSKDKAYTDSVQIYDFAALEVKLPARLIDKDVAEVANALDFAAVEVIRGPQTIDKGVADVVGASDFAAIEITTPPSVIDKAYADSVQIEDFAAVDVEIPAEPIDIGMVDEAGMADFADVSVETPAEPIEDQLQIEGVEVSDFADAHIESAPSVYTGGNVDEAVVDDFVGIEKE